jgi:hypothetical protein
MSSEQYLMSSEQYSMSSEQYVMSNEQYSMSSEQSSLFPRGSKVVMPRDVPLNFFVKIIQFVAKVRIYGTVCLQ